MVTSLIHCFNCGEKLTDREIDGRVRRWCGSCSTVNYENPIPSVAVVITDENDRILLTKRNAEPGIGLWCLPGGFMELGETAEDTVIRETLEETGLQVVPGESLGPCSKIAGFHGDVVLLGFTAEIIGGVLEAGDDADEVGFFGLNELPEIAFNCHKYFIEKHLNVEI